MSSLDVNEQIVYVVIIPVVVGILKSLFAEEIRYYLCMLYYLCFRPFDLDRDPATHDWCMLYNPGDGSWSPVSITYCFGSGFRSRLSGVYVHRYETKRDSDTDDADQLELLSVERVPFNEWASCKKARLIPENPPASVQRHIQHMRSQNVKENI